MASEYEELIASGRPTTIEERTAAMSRDRRRWIATEAAERAEPRPPPPRAANGDPLMHWDCGMDRWVAAEPTIRVWARPQGSDQDAATLIDVGTTGLTRDEYDLLHARRAPPGSRLELTETRIGRREAWVVDAPTADAASVVDLVRHELAASGEPRIGTIVRLSAIAGSVQDDDGIVHGGRWQDYEGEVVGNLGRAGVCLFVRSPDGDTRFFINRVSKPSYPLRSAEIVGVGLDVFGIDVPGGPSTPTEVAAARAILCAPRTDILAAVLAWIAATPLLDGGDEARWYATDPATRQGVNVGGAGVGPRRRTSPNVLARDPGRERRAIEPVAIDIVRALAADVAYHAAPPPGVARAYNVRPLGPVVELRRSFPLTGAKSVERLSTAAIVAAGRAIERARATAPLGEHLGTDGGRRRDMAACGA